MSQTIARARHCRNLEENREIVLFGEALGHLDDQQEPDMRKSQSWTTQYSIMQSTWGVGDVPRGVLFVCIRFQAEDGLGKVSNKQQNNSMPSSKPRDIKPHQRHWVQPLPPHGQVGHLPCLHYQAQKPRKLRPLRGGCTRGGWWAPQRFWSSRGLILSLRGFPTLPTGTGTPVGTVAEPFVSSPGASPGSLLTSRGLSGVIFDLPGPPFSGKSVSFQVIIGAECSKSQTRTLEQGC